MGDYLWSMQFFLHSPTFIMSFLLLCKGIIEQIDKYIRHIFWRGKDLEKKNPPLAAWDMICRPKNKGGLGILNLVTQNTCLLMKMIYKFINHMDIPWVHLIWEVYYPQGMSFVTLHNCSFWWRDCLNYYQHIRNLLLAPFQNGHTLAFCSDSWDEQPKMALCPTYIPILITRMIQSLWLEWFNIHLYLPLSKEAYVQYQELDQFLQAMQLAKDLDYW